MKLLSNIIIENGHKKNIQMYAFQKSKRDLSTL